MGLLSVRRLSSPERASRAASGVGHPPVSVTADAELRRAPMAVASFDLLKEPERLADWAANQKAAAIVIDSVSLWGAPGDEMIELHLKQPAEPGGPAERVARHLNGRESSPALSSRGSTGANPEARTSLSPESNAGHAGHTSACSRGTRGSTP